MASLHNRVRQYLKQQAALNERKRQCRDRQISSLCGGDLQDRRGHAHLTAKASSSKTNSCSMAGQGFFEQVLRTLNGSDTTSGRRRLPMLEIVSGRKFYQTVPGDPVCCILRQRPFAVVRNSSVRSVRRKHQRLCQPSCHCNVLGEGEGEGEGEGDGEGAGCEGADERLLKLRDMYACRCCHNHRRGPLQSVLVTPVSAALGQHHYTARPVNGHLDDGESCEVCARLAEDAAAAATSAGRRRLGQERRVTNCRAMLIYQPPPPPPPPPHCCEEAVVTADETLAATTIVDPRLESEHALTTSERSPPPFVSQKKGWC